MEPVNLSEEWGAVSSAPYLSIGLVLAVIFGVWVVIHFLYKRDRESLKQNLVNEQAESTRLRGRLQESEQKAALGTAPKPRTSRRARGKKIDYAEWDHSHRMMVSQWALLLNGQEPICQPVTDPMETGAYHIFKRLKDAVHRGELKGALPGEVARDSPMDRKALIAYYEKTDDRPQPSSPRVASPASLPPAYASPTSPRAL